MLIELKPQLFPLDMNGLRVLVREQEARFTKLTNIITAANVRIDALRKQAAPPPKLSAGVTAQEQQMFKNVAQRQLVSQIGEVRRATDKELVPIVKTMQASAGDAKEHQFSDTAAIGRKLLDRGPDGYVLPFEIISLLLLSVVIAAIVVARKTKSTTG